MAVRPPLPVKSAPIPQYDPLPSLREELLRYTTQVLLALILAVLPHFVFAEEEKWHDRLEPTGSFRLRFDSARMEGEFDDGKRDRWRFRLRAGANYDFKQDWIKIGFQVRSGNPENPISDNTTIGEGLSLDDFKLGELWAHFTATEELDIRLGRFDMRKLWTASDMQWDGDVTLEGSLQRLEFAREDNLLANLGASFYQYALEQGDDSDRAWLLGAQVRPTLELSSTHKFELGATFDYYINPQVLVDLSLSGEMGGHTVTNLLDEDNQLISDFRIASLFAIWGHEASEYWPLEISFFGYKNFGAGDQIGFENGYSNAAGAGTDNDTAYFLRGGIGRYDEFKRLELRYTYYYSEPDALVFAFTQSDSRRGSNMDGHRIDFRLGMPANTFFHVTYYRTHTSLGESPVYQSWFFDYSIRF